MNNRRTYRHTDMDYGLSRKRSYPSAPSKKPYKKWVGLSLVGAMSFVALNATFKTDTRDSSDIMAQNVIEELDPIVLNQPEISFISPIETPAETVVASAQTTIADPKVFSPLPSSKPEIEIPAERTINVAIRKGDTLGKIFDNHGLDATLLHAFTENKTVSSNLTKIHPGEELKLTLSPTNELLRLEYNVNELERLEVDVKEGKPAADIVDRDVEELLTFANATIDDSLFLAAEREGLNNNITMELARIFAWDIDFLDIQKGDQFSVIYEDRYVDGERASPGDIIAAEFVNNGKTFRAIRYEDADGHVDYYTPEGRSMRQAFLRTPLEFTRISSKFNPHRLHPIIRKIRPHRGVDYAAPIGTPVMAASDGVISMATTQRGYGKVIEIKHGSTYSTLYAHLNGFAKGMRNGVNVKQGQVIGYVGKTGMATGAHLHYEFRVNGVHKDPLTVELPRSNSLPSKYKTQFLAHASDVLEQLSNYQRVQLAEVKTPSSTTPKQS